MYLKIADSCEEGFQTLAYFWSDFEAKIWECPS